MAGIHALEADLLDGAITAERAALSSTQVNTVTFPDSLVHFIR
jgi:hypothetical protein